MKFFLLIILLMAPGLCNAQTNDESTIRKMLAAQVVEWNKGNIEGYMTGYWENDSLVFIGKNGPTYGYNETLKRYKKAYPDKEAMGILTSTIISCKKAVGELLFRYREMGTTTDFRQFEWFLYFINSKNKRELGDHK